MKRTRSVNLYKHALTVLIVSCVLLAHPALAYQQTQAVGAKQAYDEGHFQDALRYYIESARRGDSRAAVNAAIIFKDLGDYRSAAYLLEGVCLNDVQDPRLFVLLARIYFLNHQLDEAEKTALKALKRNPRDIDAMLLAGLAAQGRGQEAVAQGYYQRVLEADSENLMARVSLADIYARRRDYESAAAEYKKANLIDASVTGIQKALGEVLFRLGKLEESLQIYRKLSYANPRDEAVKKRIKTISDELGKEYFENERKRLVKKRTERVVLVMPVAAEKAGPLVRVGVAEKEEKIEFTASTPFEISSVETPSVLIYGSEKQVYSIVKTSKGAFLIVGPDAKEIVVEGAVAIKPLEPGGTVTLLNMVHGKENFWSNQADRSYRGILVVQPADHGLTVVDSLPMEEYLYSVVASEMPSRWPLEALKAQAVAARSEATKKMGRHKAQGYDFCAEVHCQAYRGVEQETQRSVRAVDETQGWVMTYQGKPVDAVYSSNCGGHTQGNIFADKRDIPYFQPVFDSIKGGDSAFPLDPFELEAWLRNPPGGILCDTASYGQKGSFRWVRAYSADELNEIVTKSKDIGAVKKIAIVKRNISGHIDAVKIFGTTTSVAIQGELKIRNALGNLRSGMFKVETRYDSQGVPVQFIFYGGGWGHGVGMCQTGAYGMAQRGKNFKEILRHYFHGVDLTKAY